jgi:hypothetical protein
MEFLVDVRDLGGRAQGGDSGQAYHEIIVLAATEQDIDGAFLGRCGVLDRPADP